MLHHVPSEALQDRLLAEVCCCLRPGGLLVDSDTLPSLRFRLYHLTDTMARALTPRTDAALGPVLDKYPEFADWETETGNTRPVSNAGTPQPRVKLSLGGRKSRGGTESMAQSDDDE